MIEFKPYESRPVIRQAFQLTASHTVTKSDVHPATYFVSHCTADTVQFKAYQEPVVGDWIVRLTEDDTYHCTDAVFRERNIVP